MWEERVLTPRSKDAIRCLFTDTAPRTSRTCFTKEVVGAESMFNERSRVVND